MKVKLREFFVCNACRATCSDSSQCMTDLQEMFPRKQEIGCLGKFCDCPCDLQDLNSRDLTVEKLIPLVLFLGEELNKFLVRKSPIDDFH
jgi:hypothetical protein